MSSLPPVPDTLGGRYRLRDRLGEGGMAQVFRAWDATLNVERAIKVLRVADPPASWRRRLQTEAKAMARLRHPNVVQVYDAATEGPLDYIVMELVTGGSLADELDRRGPLPLAEVRSWMMQVLQGLHAAHRAGIVHRDVKPSNILLDENRDARLADFGIAMMAGPDLRRTRPGVAMGSLAFMPPEQRQDAATVTQRADQYAAGATLYRLLTGRAAVDLFLAGTHSERWEGLPHWLVLVLRRACHEQPQHRYASAEAFAEALATADGRTDLVPPPEVERGPLPPLASAPSVSTIAADPQTVVQERPPKRWRRERVAFVTTMAAAVLTVIGMAALQPRPGPIDAPAPTPALESPIVELPQSPLPEPPTAPTVTPTPSRVVAPEPRRAAPRPPGSSPITGRWRMSLNGVRFELELKGSPGAVVGTARSSLDGEEVRIPLQGRFETADRRVTLDEVLVDGADVEPATYTMVFDESFTLARGMVEVGGSRRVVTLRRRP